MIRRALFILSSRNQIRYAHTDFRNKNIKITASKPVQKGFQGLEAKKVEPDQGKFGSIGEEISGKKLDKNSMIINLNKFYQESSIRQLARSHDIDDKLFTRAFMSFKRYCYQSISLPPELHIKFCDIIEGHGHISDLYPFFLSHAREAFPHLECHAELRKISNLGLPHNWYPIARSISRKVYYHAGPTNSGKTHHALKRFFESKSGIYCGPLKLLAAEIYHRANENGVPCDLLTGEERKYANPDGYTKSPHISCTVEMAQINENVETVVIDEIQMIKDIQRGWAWTRALLGIPAEEVHLCGEEAALDVIKKILAPTCDTLDVINYKRLTPLVVEEKPLQDLTKVQKGDCIVCFSKDNVYSVSMELERLGFNVAVIYGTLPPGAKISQCKKFNLQKDCDVMVATDAIGMGLNLSIKRIIFHSLFKITLDETGNFTNEYLSTSQCLQIAGRAGRYKTLHEVGYVTCIKPEDLRIMREIMSSGIPPIERAGLHPTAEQIELFAYHLPHLSLTNLVDLFMDICEYDSSAFFMCDMENFKELAKTIDHIEMPLRTKYVFCCAPINAKSTFVLAMFTKFARQFGGGEPITPDWLKKMIGWPQKLPRKIDELAHLEAIFDVFELYKWLGYRFSDMFCQIHEITELQIELDKIITDGVSDIVGLLRSTPQAKIIKRRIKERGEDAP